MKKMKLFLAPLLVLPFLASCGGNSQSEGFVTATEFERALSFYDAETGKKPVQFLQSKMTVSLAGTEYMSHQVEYSPTIYHSILIQNIMTTTYVEDFIKKNDDSSYYKASRLDKKDDKYGFNRATADEFGIPTVDENIWKMLKDQGIGYDKFKFASGVFTGNVTIVIPEYPQPIPSAMTIKFNEKKAEKVVFDMSEAMKMDAVMTQTYTYKEVSPTFPEMPDKFQMTFYEEGGSEPIAGITQTVTIDSPTFTFPAHPSRSNSEQWYSEDLDEYYNPGTVLDLSITESGLRDYKFEWKEHPVEEYTFTFYEADGETVFITDKVHPGESFEFPEGPTETEGYAWYYVSKWERGYANVGATWTIVSGMGDVNFTWAKYE
ncbi:MAG: hypothetical protein MJ207_00970 [Bacilli bacterium]|nr:hypothetical protein [Bacilli bacterium]